MAPTELAGGDAFADLGQDPCESLFVGAAFKRGNHARQRTRHDPGPPGSGKTGFAYYLAVELILHGRAVEFANVRRLLAALRHSFTEGEQIDDVDRALAADVLVLDDLGAERPTAFALETIGLIVETRHADLKTTIVTTNYAPAQLALRLRKDDVMIGQRIVSRLIEDSLRITLNRRDLRVRKDAAA